MVRTPDWADAARSDFEARLRRARAQYLPIKAIALRDAGRISPACELELRVLADPGPYAQQELPAAAYELLSDIARQQEDPDQAQRIARYADAGATWWIEALGWWRGDNNAAMSCIIAGAPAQPEGDSAGSAPRAEHARGGQTSQP